MFCTGITHTVVTVTVNLVGDLNVVRLTLKLPIAVHVLHIGAFVIDIYILSLFFFSSSIYI